MTHQICDLREAREHSPSLDERIAGLRRRRKTLTHLIDSLTAYAHDAGQQSDLTYVRHLHDPSRQVPDQYDPGNLGQRAAPGVVSRKRC